jgi:DNA-binding transcriptional ArsR family regulator
MPAYSPAELDRALRAVADANRRAILAAIRGGPRSVGAIAEELGLSQQVTSHHLGVLKAARLANGTRVGKQHLFSTETDGLQVVQTFLNEFWPTRLSALKAAVEARKAGRDG